MIGNISNTNRCPACNVSETRVEEREQTFTVQGEPITVYAPVRVCAKCGETILDLELDDAMMAAVYTEYRRRHNILSPEEIRELRERYGLSQRSFALLLGWGEVTIHRYEQGKFPDTAHNLTLRLLTDPENMRRTFEENRARLSAAVQRRVAKRVEEVSSGVRVHDRYSRQAPRKPSVLTGYREFSSAALREMVLFFASQGGGIVKTKLNKLLFYADFLAYRAENVSLSGSVYVHLPYGPVPDDYSLHLGWMEKEGDVIIEETDFEGGYVGEVFKAARPVDWSLLPPGARTILEAVHRRFASVSAKEISRLSHSEPGYLETSQSEAISYEYALRMVTEIPLTDAPAT